MINRLLLSSLILIASISGCSSLNNESLTYNKTAEILGFNCEIYDSNDDGYDSSKPIEPYKANTYLLEDTKKYSFVIHIQVGNGSVPPRIPASSFSISHNDEYIDLYRVYNSSTDIEEYIPYILEFNLELKKNNCLTPIIVKLDEFSKTYIIENNE